MTINSKALVASGVEIGQAVFMEESQPIDLEFFGRRYLRSGYVETDTSLFDVNIFTDKSFLGATEQTTGIGGSSVITTTLYANNRYLAGVGGGSLIYYSDDSISWSSTSIGFPATRDSAYDGTNYLIVGGTNSFASSVDAVTWDDSTPFSIGNVFTILYADGLYIAGGAGGGLEVSSDLVTWTARTSQFGGTDNVRGSAYGNSIYVIVGDGGKLSSSPNAVTWTARTSQFGSAIIRRVRFINNKFIAVGDDGKVSSSDDGLTWTAHTTGFTGSILDVDYVSDRYIIVGQSGEILSSADLSLWETETTGQSVSIRTITSNGSFVITAGDSGSLYTSNYNNYAGSTVEHIENDEHQYIRIS